MKTKKASKAKYDGALFVRMDVETIRALKEVAKLTERKQADALRWCIRKIEKLLKSDTLPK